MVANRRWSPVHEPFLVTLRRNVLIALAVGGGVAWANHRLALWPFAAALALWFSLGGHYVEILFLNGVRHWIPLFRLMQISARVAVWFAGGAMLYTLMALTARALPVMAPSFERWWVGSLILIGAELVVHTVLALRRLPNFYAGSG